MKEFKDIKTRDDVAEFLEVPLQKLTYILYHKKTDTYYTSFEIPKKNGEMRCINAPGGDLKKIQKKLSVKLCEVQKKITEQNQIQTNISHAFEKEKGIITNAKVHKNKRYILNYR